MNVREIKFRGLTIYGEWAYGLLSKDERGWFISNDHGKPFAFHVRPETIGQFTGLHDKNGREIYEGDIVKHQWNGCEEEGPFIVESLEWAYIENRNEKNGKLTCISEIIGNIYDNPELVTTL